jgi:hypothetical protein
MDGIACARKIIAKDPLARSLSFPVAKIQDRAVLMKKRGTGLRLSRQAVQR